MTHPGAVFAIRTRGGGNEAIDRALSVVPWRAGPVRIHQTTLWTIGVVGAAEVVEVGGVVVALVSGANAPSAAEFAADIRELGIRAIENLLEDHSAVVVDERDGLLHLSRDFMGTRPLCWSTMGADIAISSEPLAVPLLLGLSPQEDAETVWHYCAKTVPPVEATFYEGVQSVPPDSIVTIAEQQRVRRKRPFTPMPTPASDDKAIESARNAVNLAVQSRMIGAGSVACHASGGVDSGVVAASACAGGSVLSLVTHRVDGIVDDETGRAAELAQQHHVRHDIVPIKPIDLVESVLRDIRVHGPTHPTFWLSGATVKHAAMSGADRVLTGHLGDEWLTMAGGPLAQAAWQGDLHRVPAFAKDRHDDWGESWPSTVRATARLAASGVIKRRDFPQHVMNRFSGDAWVQRTMMALERVGSLHGVGVEMPFADRRYVQTILGMTAWQRNRPGRPKHILREAFADLLPESYVTDPIKANFFDVPSMAFDGEVEGSAAWARIRELWLEEWRRDLLTVGKDL